MLFDGGSLSAMFTLPANAIGVTQNTVTRNSRLPRVIWSLFLICYPLPYIEVIVWAQKLYPTPRPDNGACLASVLPASPSRLIISATSCKRLQPFSAVFSGA